MEELLEAIKTKFYFGDSTMKWKLISADIFEKGYRRSTEVWGLELPRGVLIKTLIRGHNGHFWGSSIKEQTVYVPELTIRAKECVEKEKFQSFYVFENVQKYERGQKFTEKEVKEFETGNGTRSA